MKWFNIGVAMVNFGQIVEVQIHITAIQKKIVAHVGKVCVKFNSNILIDSF
jgi:hypothetical protein